MKPWFEYHEDRRAARGERRNNHRTVTWRVRAWVKARADAVRTAVGASRTEITLAALNAVWREPLTERQRTLLLAYCSWPRQEPDTDTLWVWSGRVEQRDFYRDVTKRIKHLTELSAGLYLSLAFDCLEREYKGLGISPHNAAYIECGRQVVGHEIGVQPHPLSPAQIRQRFAPRYVPLDYLSQAWDPPGIVPALDPSPAQAPERRTTIADALGLYTGPPEAERIP